MGNLSVVKHERSLETVQFGVHIMIDGYIANRAAMTD